jgi:hypothetical protein
VKDIGLSAEELAALLDGKLDQSRRAELLARLGSSEEALEAYANAASVVSELETGDTARSAAPSKVVVGVSRRLPQWGWVALAATLAGVAVVPWLLTRGRSVDQEDPTRFVSLLAPPGQTLPRQWYGTPWPGMRGAGEPLTATARAARLGVRLVDLELAVRARDTTVSQATAEIIDLIEGLPAGSPVAAVYREIGQRAAAGTDPKELEPLLARGRSAVAELAGTDLVQLGAWAEAGRIAAAQHNPEFFRTPGSRSMLERAPSISGLTEPARALVQRLQASLAPEGRADWNELARVSSDLVRVLGS